MTITPSLKLLLQNIDTACIAKNRLNPKSRTLSIRAVECAREHPKTPLVYYVYRNIIREFQDSIKSLSPQRKIFHPAAKKAEWPAFSHPA
ncbi:hypothetical protein ATW55_00920 [Ferroacidibacillus organovorans]|uniref:Uncharacterized protein n=1 Tax=Ferroacidibacillus organovorans TaxID=1765683 RepID=A0A101XRZ2_9BACL|nr:hypothetical protein ATW55_00920 [Ferroacidibacillus organovorans]